jgi:hypothetical protein
VVKLEDSRQGKRSNGDARAATLATQSQMPFAGTEKTGSEKNEGDKTQSEMIYALSEPFDVLHDRRSQFEVKTNSVKTEALKRRCDQLD